MFRIHENTPDSESLVLTEFKNNYFIKIGGTKKIHGSNSRGTSRTQRLSTKNFFQIKNLLKIWSFLESLHRNLSEKKYMSQQITWNFRVFQENPFLLFQFSANFSFRAKFDNEVQQTLCQNFNHKIYNS